MKISRLRLVLAALLLASLVGGGFAYFKYKKISNYLIGQITGQAAKKLGRQVRFKSISFSPLDGIVIKDACVSRRPDFSKGNFFCAARTVIRPQLSALLRNRVYFSKIAFEDPVLKVREKNGVWDFADLLALLPKTDKDLYLTWNANELTMTGGALEADLETSGLSLALENADISLSHYSSFGGNYGLKAGGTVKTAAGGKLLSADVKIEADANFDYAGLSSTKGTFTAANSAYGAITLDALNADWSLFNLRRPLAEKNYSIALSAEKLLVPGQENSLRDSVAKGLKLFSAAMGKPTPAIEDIEMSRFTAAFRLKDSTLSVHDILLRTNFLDLDASLSINGPQKKADAGLKAEIGHSELAMSASGPMSDPEIKPLLSSALSAEFKSALENIENSLLKLFPVTGEPHV